MSKQTHGREGVCFIAIMGILALLCRPGSGVVDVSILPAGVGGGSVGVGGGNTLK